MASSLCNIQDGNAAAVAAGTGANVTPGNTVTVSLIDPSNVTSWFFKAIWTNGAVSEATFSANNLTITQSPTYTCTFTAPAEATGFVFYSEVIATSGVTVPFSRFGVYCAGAGNVRVTFPADPNQLIQALQSPHFEPAAELAGGAGAASPKVRAVATSIAAYNGSGTGTLTASANGAIGTQDGLTLNTGDLIHLPTGLANVTAADAGPYVVTSAGGASAKYVLSRPGWFAQGSTAQVGMTFDVFAGTLYGGSTWKATAVGSVVGTADAAFYPRSVSQSLTLVAGTTTITNVPILSATKTNFVITRTTASGTASTITYQPVGAITPGALGTASVTIDATVAAGTINSSDVSTVTVTIVNQL